MRNPRDFFRPRALGAPEPLREIPALPTRMIHFFDPSNPKMVGKLPELAGKVDVLLGNLEDAIPAERKLAAREALIERARKGDLAPAQLWTRVNSLDSPWGLDDLMRIVTEAGRYIDVIMLPKVEGPWDIHYADQLVAQLEARARLERPILLHAILETPLGVANVEAIAAASPRMQGLSLGPADLAASRRMKTTRVGGGHPGYVVRADPVPGQPDAARPAFQQDLWHYTLARMIDACAATGARPYYGPFGAFDDPLGCEDQFRNAFLMGCVGAWSLHPSQIEIARRVFSPSPEEVAWAKRVVEALPDGTGAAMIDGKMQDDATYKQCRVVLETARRIAERDSEYREALRILISAPREPHQTPRDFRTSVSVRQNFVLDTAEARWRRCPSNDKGAVSGLGASIYRREIMQSHSRIGIAAGLIGLAALMGTANVSAQTLSNAPAINPLINCSAGAGSCRLYKYGFGQADSYTNGEPNAYDVLAKNHSSFSGSYFYSKNNPVPGAVNCIAERGFVPVVGQLLIREEADCLPPVLGAGVCKQCIAPGCTNGTACSSGFDCPNGLCSNLDAGCPVEIASDQAVPGQDITFGSGFVSVTPTPFGPIFVSTAFNGAMVTDGPGLWEPDKRLGIGRRFQRPGGGTQIFWIDQLNGGGNTPNSENYSTLCCNDVAGGALCSGQLFQTYPNLTLLPDRANEGRNEAPWLYPTDNPATPTVEGNWTMDPDYSVPGQVHGNCSVDRRIGCSRPGALSNASCTAAGAPHFCCTGAGTGNCGTECVVAPGVDLGPCDLRERGWRFNRALSSLADGTPDKTRCNASPFFFRGFLNQYCSVVVAYNECLALSPQETCVGPAGKRIGRCTDSVPGDGIDTTQVRCSPGPSPLPLTANGNLRWGDPGPDCAIRNYGPQMRPDINCDGLEDPTVDTNADGVMDLVADRCPYYSEINTVDTDPSPAVNSANHDNTGRMDECECGDSNRDGLVTVSDIVDINTKIFNPPGQGTPAQGNADLSAPLSDTNEDGLFNVSDIVAVNIDIFSPLQTSRCGRSPVIGE